MSLKITWTPLAKITYFEEIDFIESKWNQYEVEKFIVLVNDFVTRLSTGLAYGKKYPIKNINSIVISKQTTVFFKFYPTRN